MEAELLGLDFDPETIGCVVAACTERAAFIVKFAPHPHAHDRWYPVCVKHAKHSETTSCRKCSGLLYKRQAIEAL